MPDQIQLRGGSEQDNDSFTGSEREITVDTTSNTLRVHDGTTAGGHSLIQGTTSIDADAETIALRDAWGRLQVADPQDDQDATSKSYVDGAIADSVALTAYKTADQSVASSTTLQDDNHLLIPVGAGEVWAFEATLFIDAGATGADIKVGISWPSVDAGILASLGAEMGLTDPSQTTIRLITRPESLEVFAGIDGTFGTVMRVFAAATIGATPGDVTLRWAQYASSATATTIKKYSYLVGKELA